MYTDTLYHFALLGQKKAELIKRSPLAFCVGAILAGAYIGFGIILIFSVGATIDPAWQKLVMGVSFGIALTLIVFAGAELFTGHTLYMPLARLQRLASSGDLIKVWSLSWLFNLMGGVILALLFVAGGGGALLNNDASLLNQIAAYKMHSSPIELVARATLCNWLVCLALWMAARTQSDAAKTIVIFWCLFAFIASGFEHSVANMSLLSIALLGNPTEAITLSGMAYNLLWVTLGNVIGGSVFMAGAYWLASGRLAAKVIQTSRPTNQSINQATKQAINQATQYNSEQTNNP